jgi:hypothetical protein
MEHPTPFLLLLNCSFDVSLAANEIDCFTSLGLCSCNTPDHTNCCVAYPCHSLPRYLYDNQLHDISGLSALPSTNRLRCLYLQVSAMHLVACRARLRTMKPGWGKTLCLHMRTTRRHDRQLGSLPFRGFVSTSFSLGFLDKNLLHCPMVVTYMGGAVCAALEGEDESLADPLTLCRTIG